MKEKKIEDINIIVLSDHGFADVSDYIYLDECIPDIHQYINNDTAGNSPIIFIHTNTTGK